MSHRWLTIAAVATAGAFAQGQPVKPLAQWRFDESQGPTARDSAGGVADSISGLYKFVRGVSGNALQFDGYTTYIQRQWKQAPPVAGGFTVEAWVALDAYPWNWVPIVDWERDFQAGYLFGIDAYGRIGLHLAVAGSWQVLSSNSKIPLKRWTHVAASFDPARGIALYIDGKKAGEIAATGALTPPERTDLLIGRVREKMMPVPSGLIHPGHTIYYSLEGVLDELTIHGRALDAAEIASAFAAVKVPPGMSSPWAVMPAGTPGPGRFGAYYATLNFQDTWARPRRIGPESDVVVRFPQSGMRLAFWQGNNYVPAWVTENGKWYTDEFLEAYNKPQCPDSEDCEPMSDKQERYSHVRILESTDARVVVHWRYALSESENYKGAYPDPLTGWFDWGDEYWTVYPDGVAVRKQVLWSSHLDGVLPGDKVGPAPHEFQETIVLNGPGQWPEDNIQFDALTLANMKGETSVYAWREKSKDVFDYPHGPDAFPNPADANIQWINLKSAWKPFQIVSLPARFTAYNGEKTLSSFEWWNHWPVAQFDSSGRPALAPDRASHTSLSHIYWPSAEATESTVTKLLMDGLTLKPAAELVPLAKSWLKPAAAEATGLRSEGYQAAERAYVLRCEGKAEKAEITLRASSESPVVNPALIVRNWNGGARVLVNGEPRGRIGQVFRLEGTDLVVWLELEATRPVMIQIEPQ
ncbi:MAG: LamG domain-containing protein [Bryobacteraceae bacterium]|jgi:hypothetical protein